jgi:hypothetical protein
VDWSDVLRAALSFFLVITGIGLGYLLWRVGNVFAQLQTTVVKVTDEFVPILEKTQTTMDGVNQEIARVDTIMESAIHATQGAEKVVGTLSHAVSAPVRKLTGLAAGAQEGLSVFRARRAAERAERQQPTAPLPVKPVEVADPVGTPSA